MKIRIPIGIQDYRKLRIGNYYTVDKSLMIAEFLERGFEATLVTRPRRFGKTLNMSMLSEFFDITKDSKALFNGLAIMDTPYVDEMNQYPVIFISFKDCKGSYEDIVKYTKLSILSEFKRYKYIFKNMDEFDIPRYEKMIECLSQDEVAILRDANNAIAFLANQLELYYEKKVMVFIDEYDTPFIEAHIKGCYDKVHDDLSSLLRTVLKGCESVYLAMLTGIQRVAKENIFSDLNNLAVCTVRDKDYSQFFGFTKEEVKTLLEENGIPYNEEVKQMYDGYRFADMEIYNPWSIINYTRTRELKPYWVNTSSNSMIKNAMGNSDRLFNQGFEKLIMNKYLDTQIQMETSFYEQSQTPSLWGLFVNAGYLTIEEELYGKRVRLRVPNNEVSEEFISLTENYLKVNEGSLNNLFYPLLEKDVPSFFEEYQRILLTIPSYYDLKDENSLHVLMLGMSVYLKTDYDILSNIEIGKGRPDIVLKKKKEALPNIVIELKYSKKADISKEDAESDDNLKKLASDALKQIKDCNYTTGLQGDTICIGLAHAGKQACMEYEEIFI